MSGPSWAAQTVGALLAAYEHALSSDQGAGLQEARLSAPFTACAALERLGRAGLAPCAAQAVRVLVLGPDGREGSTWEELAGTFTPLARLLSARHGTGSLHLVLAGPNLPLAGRREWLLPEAAGAAPSTLRLSCHQGLYHELQPAGDLLPPFAIALACNAGIWGYPSWAPTVHKVCCAQGIPLVITSYNDLEADDDAGALEGLGLEEHVDWAWAPEENPCRVAARWRNAAGRWAADSAWWQCVLPGAGVGPPAAGGPAAEADAGARG